MDWQKVAETSEAENILDARTMPRRGPAGSRWWLWFVALALLAGGIWFFRGRQGGDTAQIAPGKGPSRGGRGGGSFVVPVVVATAQRADLPVYLTGIGTVSAFNTVTVRSRIDGQIVGVYFREGQFVKQGDLLVQIDPRPFQVQLEQAQGQLAKDRAQLHDAQANFERYQALFKEGVIPRQQLDSQQASVEQFQGAIQSDQAQIDNAKLQLTYARITAPINGRAGLRLVDQGNIIHANDPQGLLLITQLQPISVLFSLPQDQLPQVYPKLRAGAQMTVEAYDRDDVTRIATGKLLTIDNQIDIATGTYKLKAVFGNENGSLFPNQFVNVHLLVETKKGATVVPAVAMQRGPQGTYLYLVKPDNTVKIQTVTTSVFSGNVAGIASGLQPGDVVVIDGQDKLQDGSKIDPRPPAGSGGGQNGVPRTGPAWPEREKGASPRFRTRSK